MKNKNKEQVEINFKTLFEAAPGLFLILKPNSPHFTILGVSNAYLHATMTERNKITGCGLFEVFPDNPGDHTATGVSNLRKSLENVLKSKVADKMEIQKYDIQRSQSEGGGFEERHWRPLNAPILNGQNEIEYIIHRVEDVTEFVLQKREVEEHVEKVNQFLDTILENIPNMVFVKDADELRFVRFNKAGEKLLGYSRQDLIGKNDYDFFPKEQAAFFISKDRDAINRMDVTNIPEEMIKTAFGDKWLHTKKIPILDDNGTPIFLLGISEDITKKKHAEEMVKELNNRLLENLAQLESVNKELESFSYSVSHDLRAPLRAIDGYAGILEEDYGKILDEEGNRLLEAVQYNAKKMGNLIDDLLAFSRLGKKEPTKTNLNMTELVEAALYEFNKSVKHNATVKIKQLDACKGDYGLINQVVINLLSNAIKYSAKVKDPLVEISSEKTDTEIIYYVKDNGAGFDMRYVHKLFGVFQRLHTMDEFEGTGVGLAIVKRIMNKHGGKVSAEGEKNKGAVFKFSMPIN